MKTIYSWDNMANAHIIWRRLVEIAIADLLRTMDVEYSVNFKHVILKNWFKLDNQECIKITDWLRTTASWITPFEYAILYNRTNLTDREIRKRLKRAIINPCSFDKYDKQIKAPTLDFELIYKLCKKFYTITWLKLDYTFFGKAKLKP